LLIPIPTFRRVWKFTAQGYVWQTTACEHCGCRYRYQIVRTSTHESGSFSDRAKAELAARTKADLARELEKAKEATEPAACPACGRYQVAMVQRILSGRRAAGYIVAVCILIPLVTLAYELHSWITLAVCVVAVGSVVALAEARARRDPNRDAAARVVKRDPKRVILLESEFSAWASAQEAAANAERRNARWSVSISGGTYGPYSDERLKAMVRNGEVAPTALAWREGLSSWVPVRDLPEIRGK
jgi:GYF domain 2